MFTVYRSLNIALQKQQNVGTLANTLAKKGFKDRKKSLATDNQI
jgi:hypothetical protein